MYTGRHRASRRAFGTLSLLTALAMVVGLLAGTGGGAVAHTEGEPLVQDLIADGGDASSAVDVGDVLVWNGAGNLYVKYVIDDPDWCITQTHLDVATLLSLIPQKNGNPIPGHFDYADMHDCVTEYTYTVPLNGWTVDTALFIAAHAVVWDKTSETSTTVFSSTNTDITEVNGTPVTAKAVSANEPFSYPTCAAYTPDDTNKSVWDNGIGSAFNTFAAAPAADWIWNVLNPEHPILGDWVKFQETFSVPGLPVGGTLYITADNGYKAMLNGTDVGSAQLGPGFPGTLRETVSTPPPQQGDWGVASQGWQSVEAYSLSGLVSGENSLMITATNEYMWNDGGYSGPDYYYGNWNPPGGSVNADPSPGTGIGGDGICRNPGGLIFKATMDYYARSETAWGAGSNFSGRNWATYISYTVQ
jgi:hypothetical protein